MITRTLPELKEGQTLNAARLYQVYTGLWLEREIRKGRTLITPADRRLFAEELAIEMLGGEALALHYSRIPGRVNMIRARFPVVAIQSHEENRVIEALADIADRQDKALFTWAISNGVQQVFPLSNPAHDARLADPIAVLRHILEYGEPADELPAGPGAIFVLNNELGKASVSVASFLSQFVVVPCGILLTPRAILPHPFSFCQW